MPTPRETILQALLAALQTVPNATVLRGAILPERIPTGGLLILRDGDPGTPEVTLHSTSRSRREVLCTVKHIRYGRMTRSNQPPGKPGRFIGREK